MQCPLKLMEVQGLRTDFLKSEIKSFLMFTIFWDRDSREPEEMERAACALCQFAKIFPKLRTDTKATEEEISSPL